MEREIAEWIKDLGNQTTSEDTKRGYWYSVREFQRFAESRGVTTILGVTRSLVTDWFGTYRERGISPHTVQRHSCALRSFLRYCRDVGHVDRTLDAPVVRARKKHLPRALTESDVASILAGIGKRRLIDIRDRALIEFLWSTGCRASEVCNVELADVRFYHDPNTHQLKTEITVTGKGDKMRQVWLTSAATESLRTYLDKARRPNPIPKHERSLFVSREGQRLDRKILGQMVKRRARDAGIPGIVTTHRFRHSMAVAFLKRGGSVNELQRMLGHSSLATTGIYLQVDPDDCRRSHARMEEPPSIVDHIERISAPLSEPEQPEKVDYRTRRFRTRENSFVPPPRGRSTP